MGPEPQSGHPALSRWSAPPALLIATLAFAVSSVAFFASPEPCSAQAAPLPDAPKPQNFVTLAQPHADPCQVRNLGAAMATVAVDQAVQVTRINSADPGPSNSLAGITVPCPPRQPNWYDRFTDGPTNNPLTPKDKAWLAARNVVDPLNGVSILGTSAIIIGANSHSPYGPGMPGFARNVGVAYAQDMTGEFFGTFVIPSIFHQNPHYHRMPHASIPRRLLNTCTQVFWTRSDSGQGMLNYANIIGFAIDDAIGNLYVPGRATNLPSSATRYAVTFAFAPTNNLVSEFLPDVIGRFHFQSVVIQHILNAVAKPDAP